MVTALVAGDDRHQSRAATTASRSTMARGGTSVPGVRAPTQISAAGLWSSTASPHTAVSRMSGQLM
jgi:hypothetical protein